MWKEVCIQKAVIKVAERHFSGITLGKLIIYLLDLHIPLLARTSTSSAMRDVLFDIHWVNFKEQQAVFEPLEEALLRFGEMAHSVRGAGGRVEAAGGNW